MIREPLREYRFSLRARATSWYVGLLAMALVVFSVGIYVCIRTYLNESLQRAPSGTAHTISDDFLAKLPTKGDAWVLGEIRESYEATPNDHCEFCEDVNVSVWDYGAAGVTHCSLKGRASALCEGGNAKERRTSGQ